MVRGRGLPGLSVLNLGSRGDFHYGRSLVRENLQELSENWVSNEQLLFLHLHASSIIHIVALTAETRVVCAGRSVLILTNRCRCCPLGRESKC